ncbi:MAG: hypothetical protein GY810_02460 [Aureispira sp.]|nr:hypothetical protein [Aureispira sp.]
MAVTPSQMQRVELISIFINNILLLLGITVFGWTLFETLFLYWLEPLSAVTVLIYLNVVTPLRYGRPGTHLTPEFQKPAWTTVGTLIYVLVLHYIALLYMIDLCKVETWDTSQGIFHTLAQMPGELYSSGLLWLTLLFLVAYLLPPMLLERRGVKPSYETMPLQSKIMIHPVQFVTNYAFLGLVYFASFYTTNAIILVLILVILKSIVELILFYRIKNQLF